MMTLAELRDFTVRRARRDNPIAFAARVARFGVIGAYIWRRELKGSAFHKYPEPYIEREIWGNKMLLDPKDGGISTDLFLDNTREPYVCEALRKKIKPGEIVYDIGANIGYYVLQEASLVGETGKVYAIEPVGANLALLRKNLALNQIYNVMTYKYAIGEQGGFANINISPFRNMCSMVKKDGYRKYVGQEQVPVITIDEFMEDRPYPDWLRMDIEGYELEAMKGATKILHGNRPIKAFIEVHFDILQERSIEFLKLMRSGGFEVSVATYECHPAIRGHRLTHELVKLLEAQIGCKSGYNTLTISQMIENPVYRNGQVEDLEVIFERA